MYLGNWGVSGMRSEKPNIILIVLDAVRFDHLSCYGYEKHTTPNIDRLADHGVLFENAFSTSSWTPTSCASIFTGRYPSNNGVLAPNFYLSKDNIMITQILHSHGYRTLGAGIPAHLNRSRGYDRGWDKFWESYKDNLFRTLPSFLEYNLRNLIDGGWKNLNSPKEYYDTIEFNFFSFYINKNVKKWLEKIEKENFFLFIHHEEAHCPYYPLPQFKEKFERKSGSSMDQNKLRHVAHHGGYAYMAGDICTSESEWDVLKSWYDAEIFYIDYRVKEILEFLNEIGIYENTVIIITSDHGENFGEHHLHLNCPDARAFQSRKG